MLPVEAPNLVFEKWLVAKEIKLQAILANSVLIEGLLGNQEYRISMCCCLARGWEKQTESLEKEMIFGADNVKEVAAALYNASLLD